MSHLVAFHSYILAGFDPESNLWLSSTITPAERIAAMQYSLEAFLLNSIYIDSN